MLTLWEEGGEDDRALADLMAALGGKLPLTRPIRRAVP